MRTRLLVIVGLTASLAAASVAAQTSVGKSFTTTSKDCSGVQWSQEALTTYPGIASACQGVMEREGKTYVKFQGTVEKNAKNGQELTIKFKDGQKLTLTPPPETQLYIAGQKTKIKELTRGTELSFYVPQDRFTAQLAQNQEETQYVAARIVPVAPEPEQVASLPSTATQLPLIALLGVMLVGFGATLTLRRLARR